MKLYVSEIDTNRTMLAIRAVRAGLIQLGLDSTATAAGAIVENAVDAGTALVGEADNEPAERAAVAMIEAADGCLRVSMRDADEGPPEGAPEDETGFSDNAYETAIALLVQADGKPLAACGFARTLAYSADDDLYAEAIAVLAYVFRPWLGTILLNNGMLTEEGVVTL